MAKWKTAFLPYWSNDADEILKVLSEIGYDGVEWLRFINFMSGDELKEICAKARAKGMGVPDIMGGADLIVLKEEERAQRVQFVIDSIEMARDASVPIVNMTTGPADWGESPVKLGKDITEGKAWEILTGQTFNEEIPAGLHPQSGAVVGHKTGNMSTSQHDAAVVRLPDGREYVLVLLANDFGANEDGRRKVIDAARKMSRAVWEAMIAP